MHNYIYSGAYTTQEYLYIYIYKLIKEVGGELTTTNKLATFTDTLTCPESEQYIAITNHSL